MVGGLIACVLLVWNRWTCDAENTPFMPYIAVRHMSSWSNLKGYICREYNKWQFVISNLNFFGVISQLEPLLQSIPLTYFITSFMEANLNWKWKGFSFLFIIKWMRKWFIPPVYFWVTRSVFYSVINTFMICYVKK